MDIIKIEPESLEVANVYLATGSVDDTASRLGVPAETIHNYLAKREVKTYIDQVYFDQGYRNRFKLASLMDKIIETKIAEADETEMYTDKDLVDLITLQHKMRMDELKLESNQPAIVNNTQNNYGGANLGKLVESLIIED